MFRLISADIYKCIRKNEGHLIFIALVIECFLSASYPQEILYLLEKRMNFELFQIVVVSIWVVKYIAEDYMNGTWMSYIGSGYSRNIIFIAKLAVAFFCGLILITASIIIPISVEMFIFYAETDTEFLSAVMSNFLVFISKSFICITIPIALTCYFRNAMVSLVSSIGIILLFFRIYDQLFCGHGSEPYFLLLSFLMCDILIYRMMRLFENADLE